MTQRQGEMVENFLKHIIAPDALAEWVLIAGVILAIGLVSAHYLRQQPDFEHKKEMMWGAHWFWAVVLAAEAVFLGSVYAALAYTLYMATVVLSSVVLMPFFFWLFLHRFEWQSKGASFALAVWFKRSEGDEFDLQQWLREEQKGPTGWKKFGALFLRGTYVILVCFSVYFMLAVTYPLDREMIKSIEAEQLQSVLRERIRSGQIVEISAYSPLPESIHPDTTREGLRVALRSIRDITGTAPEPEPPTQRMEYWHIFVKVKSSVTQAQAAELADRIVAVLAQRQTEHYWCIEVSSDDDTICVHRYYPHSTHEPPREESPLPGSDDVAA